MGEDATFTCVAMGEPTPAITWVFNDQDLSNSTKYTITEVLGSVKVNSTLIVTVQSTLVVMGVEEGDAGSYTCRAENTHMMVEAPASLQPLSEFVCVTFCKDATSTCSFFLSSLIKMLTSSGKHSV